MAASPPRITDSEALNLYRQCSLHELGAMAAAICATMHPEAHRTYIVDRNVNYSNVCSARCRFCAYRAGANGQCGWTLTTEQILEEIGELAAIGGVQVLIQGGQHPELPLAWYVGLLGAIKTAYPQIHVHGFSPPEIHDLAERSGLSLEVLLGRLRDAGLDTVPGGGAEILVDRVRRRVSPGKCSAEQWLAVMRQAHRLGICTTATMMCGHIETDGDRVEHLRRLRQLQDESLAAGRGRFTAFICWTFQSANTELASDAESGASVLRLAGAVEYLRTLALARVYLDNFANLQASWVTQGPKIGQLALLFGANDMGSVMMTEKVVSAAGATFKLGEEDLRRVIADAGYQPRRRNCYYDLLDR